MNSFYLNRTEFLCVPKLPLCHLTVTESTFVTSFFTRNNRSEHPSEEVDSEGAFGYSRTDQTAANQNVEPGENVLSEENDPHQQPGEQPWIKVTRRRARSLDSVTRAPPVSREHDTRKNALTAEQARTVQTAEGALTAEQSELVRRRHDNTALQPEKSLSRGEGGPRIIPINV